MACRTAALLPVIFEITCARGARPAPRNARCKRCLDVLRAFGMRTAGWRSMLPIINGARHDEPSPGEKTQVSLFQAGSPEALAMRAAADIIEDFDERTLWANLIPSHPPPSSHESEHR